jgi:hypothetical protein
MSVDKKVSYKDQKLTKDQQKKIKPANQGGGPNYLGKQKTVTVPKKWLSSPDHVVAELAYITPREQKILLDADIYGSLKGKPNKGPGGIMSLQGDMGGFGGTGGTGGNGGNGGNGGDRDTGSDYGQFDRAVSRAANNPPSTPSGGDKDNTPPTFNIHSGPTYTPPTINVVDEVALTGFGRDPTVDYSAVGPDSQFARNTALNNQLLNTPFQGVNTPFMSLNFIGNTLGAIGHKKNTKFFSENSIGGKINPATGKPFGYGIDGYKAYMEQRALGNVGAYGGTELSQNEINRRAGGDGNEVNYYNDPNEPDDGDADGDGDVDQDDFIFRYFDKTGETLEAGAGGVQDLMKSIRKRISNIFS